MASGEHSDKVASFKSDSWKYFGFLMSRNRQTTAYTRIITYCSIEKFNRCLINAGYTFFLVFFFFNIAKLPAFLTEVLSCHEIVGIVTSLTFCAPLHSVFIWGDFFVVVVFPCGAWPLVKGERTVSLPLIPSGGFSCASSVTSNHFAQLASCDLRGASYHLLQPRLGEST